MYYGGLYENILKKLQHVEAYQEGSLSHKAGRV
jgi:hypothetical protein